MTRLLTHALVVLAVLAAGCAPAGPGPSPRTPVPLPAPDTGLVSVGRGDTVYAIARRYGVPMRAIIEENGLRAPFVLQVGQQLRLPRDRIHIVRAGDTIYAIARTYDVEMRSLVSMNGIRPPYRIKVGQALRLPTGQGGAVAPPVPQSRPDPQSRPVAQGRPVAQADSVPPLPLPRPRDGAAAAVAAAAPAAAADSGASRPATGRPAPALRMAAVPARGGSRFLWPVRGRVISNFGPREGGLHNDGINIAAPRGAPILAADNGIVAYAGSQLRGFGKLLLIKHAGGWITAYAHAERLLVRRGDSVKRGQTIATIGDSGDVTRPQLHFEVRRGSRAVDPRKELEA